MLLLLQGFVTYLPYIVYYALTHSVIYPVLNEAQDMIKITSFDITPEKETDHLFGKARQLSSLSWIYIIHQCEVSSNMTLFFCN